MSGAFLARRTVLAMGLAAVVGATAWAADDKPNPVGTWKWSMTPRDGQKIDVKLKLKLDGDKLSGTIQRGDRPETAIEEASYKEGEVKFQVTRERDGQKFTIKYEGKVSGDTLTGKVTFGDNQSRDWKAERAKE